MSLASAAQAQPIRANGPGFGRGPLAPGRGAFQARPGGAIRPNFAVNARGVGRYPGVQGRAARWRYRWHNNAWWYWTARNSWVIWVGGRWVPYNTYAYSVPSGGVYSSGSGYFPSYGYSSYGYYPRYGYRVPWWLYANRNLGRYYAGYRGYPYARGPRNYAGTSYRSQGGFAYRGTGGYRSGGPAGGLGGGGMRGGPGGGGGRRR